MTSNATLIEKFRWLTVRQQKNLLYHVRRKTPICCGANAGAYTDGRGGA
jgi:hypothetical protein